MEQTMITRDNPFVCGTRKVVETGINTRFWTVVCATCDEGATGKYAKRRWANHAAIRDSWMPCKLCGAR